MNNKLIYNIPADLFEEALPLGNGHIGAMIYGGIKGEKIALNNDELWSGMPADSRIRLRPGADRMLKRVRELTLEGNIAEAERIAEEGINGSYTAMYLPLGNINIEYSGINEQNGYKRILNMENAIATVDTQGLHREYFVPYRKSTFVMKIKGKSGFDVGFSSELKIGSVTKNDLYIVSGECPAYMLSSGQNAMNEDILGYNGNGIKFSCVMSVVSDGNVSCYDSGIRVANANESVIYFTCETSFVSFDKLPQASSLTRALNAHSIAVDKGYDKLLEEHTKIFSKMYNRVKLNISGEEEIKDTLAALKSGKRTPAMIELLYNFGRYLIISSEAKGTQAANLQGIWNEKMFPAWNSGYTTNINTQMNYWPVLSCSLPECYESLVSFIKNLSVSGTGCARDIYSAPGFVTHHNSDIWAQAEPVGDRLRGSARWGFWNMSSGWFMEHLYEFYEYTMDKEYLKNTAFPIMKAAARFYLSQLTEYEDELILCPSTSPENSYLKDGNKCCLAMRTTMSQTIVKELFMNVLKAYKELEIDKDAFYGVISSVIPKLNPFKIDDSERIMEWDEDYGETDIHHRHVSHLYGLYPSNLISVERTPKLARACKRSLEVRGDEGTGWSLAWKANLWARLNDGEHAEKLIYRQLEFIDPNSKGSWQHGGTFPNMLDAHPPFQIDGNFGITSAITQLFLQSEVGEIKLLPALPADMKGGFINGLSAKGGIKVDLSWSENGAVTAVLKAKTNMTVKIRYKEEALVLCLKKGKKNKVFLN